MLSQYTLGSVPLKRVLIFKCFAVYFSPNRETSGLGETEAEPVLNVQEAEPVIFSFPHYQIPRSNFSDASSAFLFF